MFAAKYVELWFKDKSLSKISGHTIINKNNNEMLLSSIDGTEGKKFEYVFIEHTYSPSIGRHLNRHPSVKSESPAFWWLFLWVKHSTICIIMMFFTLWQFVHFARFRIALQKRAISLLSKGNYVRLAYRFGKFKRGGWACTSSVQFCCLRK